MYTNQANISFILATWLAADNNYDLSYPENTYSATELLKPLKSIILSRRLAEQNESGTIDVLDLVQAKLGTAVHTAIENAWIYAKEQAFRNLNIPQHVQDLIKLNPEKEDDPNGIYIYMEKRSYRQIAGINITGKFDIVERGRVKDIKTTSTYNWIKGGNDRKYLLQGSIYRWLNPDIITEEFMDIEMIFTDWSWVKARADKEYPQHRVVTRTLPLLSLEATESFILDAVKKIQKYKDSKQEEMPNCSPEELWMDPPKWAYYKNKASLARATKLFDNESEAYAQLRQGGSDGVVVKRDSEPKYCNYCSGRPMCLQAQEYVNSGILQL